MQINKCPECKANIYWDASAEKWKCFKCEWLADRETAERLAEQIEMADNIKKKKLQTIQAIINDSEILEHIREQRAFTVCAADDYIHIEEGCEGHYGADLDKNDLLELSEVLKRLAEELEG